MAGYSGTPLAKKLGVKEATTCVVLDAPAGFAIPDLPPGVAPKSRLGARADLVLCFVRSRSGLATRLPALDAAIRPDGAAWIAWPKRASGVATDVTEDVVRELALPRGLVDVKVCAVDETWSGLKLVLRKELRGQRVPAARGAAPSARRGKTQT